MFLTVVNTYCGPERYLDTQNCLKVIALDTIYQTKLHLQTNAAPFFRTTVSSAIFFANAMLFILCVSIVCVFDSCAVLWEIIQGEDISQSCREVQTAEIRPWGSNVQSSLIPFTSSREDLNLVLRGAGYLPGLGLCHALTGGVLLDSAFHRHHQVPFRPQQSICTHTQSLSPQRRPRQTHGWVMQKSKTSELRLCHPKSSKRVK